MSRLGTFLVQEGILTVSDRQVIKRESAALHGSFARSVLALGLLDEDELTSLMASKTSFPQVAKDILNEMDPAVANIVPHHILAWLEVLPLSVGDGALRVAMVDPTDEDAISQMKFFTGLRIRPHIAKLSEINRGLRQIGAQIDIGESGLESLIKTIGRAPHVEPAHRPAAVAQVAEMKSAMANVKKSAHQQVPTRLNAKAEMIEDAAHENLAVSDQLDSVQEASEDLSSDSTADLNDLGQNLDDASDSAASVLETGEAPEDSGNILATPHGLSEPNSNDVSADIVAEVAAENIQAAGIQPDGVTTEQTEASPADASPAEETLEAVAGSTGGLESDVISEEISSVDVEETAFAESDGAGDAAGDATFVEAQADADDLLDAPMTDPADGPEEIATVDVASEDGSAAITAASESASPAKTSDDGMLDDKFTDIKLTESSSSPGIDDDLSPESSGPQLDFGGVASESSSDKAPQVDDVQKPTRKQVSQAVLADVAHEVEAAAHVGIAELNRALVGLQMMSDASRALQKVADAAGKIGIGAGAILSVKNGEIIPGILWRKDGAKMGSIVDSPVGIDVTAVMEFAKRSQPDDGWSSLESALGASAASIEASWPDPDQLPTLALARQHGDTVVLSLISFSAAPEHEGLRQSFGDLIRAVSPRL